MQFLYMPCVDPLFWTMAVVTCGKKVATSASWRASADARRLNAFAIKDRIRVPSKLVMAAAFGQGVVFTFMHIFLCACIFLQNRESGTKGVGFVIHPSIIFIRTLSPYLSLSSVPKASRHKILCTLFHIIFLFILSRLGITFYIFIQICWIHRKVPTLFSSYSMPLLRHSWHGGYSMFTLNNTEIKY